MTQQELNFEKPKFNFDSDLAGRRFNHKFKNTRFPVIISFHEKHGDRYFVCNSHEEIFSIAIHIFSERFESGDWYFNDEQGKIYDEDEAEAISNANDALWALDFLERHRDNEYEGYTFQNPETF